MAGSQSSRARMTPAGTGELVRLLSIAAIVNSGAAMEDFALSPMAVPQTPTRGKESAKLYGNMNKYAYYFTDLLVGSPTPQRTSVIVDTGSRIAGFPCTGCVHCGDHIDPAFNPDLSTTAKWLTCGPGCKDACVEGRCAYRETYSEGSSVFGNYFDDEVELGESKNAPVRARLGCHSNEDNLFFTQKANGIMGLAPPEDGGSSVSGRNTPTVLQDLFQDRSHVSTETFAMCLAEWGGVLTVGGDNSKYHTSPVSWTPMRANKYYFLFPEELNLQNGGVETHVASSVSEFGVSIVDSGTTYTYFPTPLFNKLTGSLQEYCDANAGCGARPVDSDCWYLDKPEEGPIKFPSLQFKMQGGAVISWAADEYLIPRREFGLWCRTFLANELYQTILGISLLRHKDIIFDIAKERVGFAQASCPEYHREDDPTGYQAKFAFDDIALPRGPRRIEVEPELRMWTVVAMLSSIILGTSLTVWRFAKWRAHRQAVRAGASASANVDGGASVLIPCEESGRMLRPEDDDCTE